MRVKNIIVISIVASAVIACGDANRFTDALAREAVNKHLSSANGITCRGGSPLQAALDSSYSTWRLASLTNKLKPSTGKGESGRLHLDLMDFEVVEVEKLGTGVFARESPRLKSAGQGIRVMHLGAIELPMLCAGKYSVDKIVKWTEPAVTEGTPTTVVTFTIRPDQMEPWTKIRSIEALFHPKQLTGGIEERLRLQKTNLGWEVVS